MGFFKYCGSKGQLSQDAPYTRLHTLVSWQVGLHSAFSMQQETVDHDLAKNAYWCFDGIGDPIICTNSIFLFGSACPTFSNLCVNQSFYRRY